MGVLVAVNRLVPCPDGPCDERCVWCCGSGRIAESTLAIYKLKQQQDSHDTDKQMKSVQP